MRINPHKKNTNALFIGAGLILLIFAITLFKNDAKKDEAQKKDPQTEKEERVMNLGKSSKISNSELASKLGSNASLLIIDIRDVDSYQKEHISNAINIPMGTDLEMIQALDKDKNCIVVDYGGDWQMAASIAGKMMEAGFKNVTYLDGGFDAWKNNYQSTVSDGDPNSFTDQAKVTYVKVEDLKKMMDSSMTLTIIDVRNENQFKEGHLKNALNIPLGNLVQRKNEIPIGRKIILYDDNGFLAFKGAVRLFDAGVFNVSSLAEGLNTWKEKKYEVVK